MNKTYKILNKFISYTIINPQFFLVLKISHSFTQTYFSNLRQVLYFQFICVEL